MEAIRLCAGIEIQIIQQGEKKTSTDTYLCRENKPQIMIVSGFGERCEVRGLKELINKIESIEKSNSILSRIKRIFS